MYVQHALHSNAIVMHGALCTCTEHEHNLAQDTCACTKCVGILSHTRNSQHARIAGLLGCTICMCMCVIHCIYASSRLSQCIYCTVQSMGFYTLSRYYALDSQCT